MNYWSNRLVGICVLQKRIITHIKVHIILCILYEKQIHGRRQNPWDVDEIPWDETTDPVITLFWLCITCISAHFIILYIILKMTFITYVKPYVKMVLNVKVDVLCCIGFREETKKFFAEFFLPKGGTLM